MNKSYQTLIIGASFYGMALLKSMGEQAILIERGYRIGSEFSASLRVNRFSGTVESRLGRDFLNGLKKHRLIAEDGAIYSAPAAYLLAELCKGVNALFATELLSVKQADGYRVTVFNTDGKTEMFVNQIIDTTAYITDGVKKKLNVILTEPGGLTTDCDSFTGSDVFGLEVGAQETMANARARLYRCMEGHGAVFAADVFDYETPFINERGTDGRQIIPSLGFSNPVSAVDAGGLMYGI